MRQPNMTESDDHLDIVLAGLAAGRTLLPSARSGDRPLLDAMAALGARIERTDSGIAVTGAGNGCLLEPVTTLALENADAALLVAGLVAPYDMAARIACRSGLPDGDRDAFLAATAAMGIQASAPDADTIVLAGQASAVPARHACAGWSQTVLRTIALAALNTPGITRLEGEGAAPTALARRLGAFGAQCGIDHRDGGWSLAVTGQCVLHAAEAESAS